MSAATDSDTPSSQPARGAGDAPLLSLRGINKSFGAVHVLQGVDLDAFAGQVTALVGDNGAGKSTLIKGIAGIYAFDYKARGSIWGTSPVVDGRVVFGDKAGWIRSEALMRLDFGPGRLPGMLVMGAEDPHQFKPTHGTDLLAFFAGIFERTMRRWLA